MKITSLLIPVLAASASAQNTVYLIRHGEKPADGSNGLTAQGMQRAQCLRNVFGPSSQYNIGYIIAEKPKKGQPYPLSFSLTINSNKNLNTDGSRTRPLMTVQPLANDLSLTVDTSCGRDDADCVADLVDNYGGGQNILICWEHDNLTGIVEALGDNNAPDYPDKAYASSKTWKAEVVLIACRFNIIWTDPQPYNTITLVTSENCPGLDN